MRAEEICQLVLRTCKAQGVSDVVVTVAQSEGLMVRFSNNEITIVNALSDATASIFVNDNGRKAGANAADLSKKGLESAAKKVVEMAKRAPAASTYAPLPQGPFSYDPKLLEGGQVSTDPKTLVPYVKEAIEAAQREGAERVAGSLTSDNGKLTLLTSNGAFGVMRKSAIELSLRAFTSGSASGHAVSVAGKEADFKPSQAGAEAGRLARMSSEASDGEPGEYDAVLGPLVFADLVNQVGRAASAFSVEAGMSFLADKVGQRVASEGISISDDPTMEGTYGSTPFDAEGLPTRRNAMVEAGVLKGYLHNSTTAKKFGTTTTANAGLVAPRPFNLVVEAGPRSLEEVIASVEKGIYVTNDWYLRYQNFQTGDFSTIPRDAMFLIENGKLSRPIKELRISDNLLRMFSSIKEVAKERSWVRWWEVEVPTLCPAALVGKVRFTKSRR
ncbi:MAG: TldD/PmbA family protein [Methanomassiliicoccales archaeon]|nr:TldD/PmbA family protein [Methanomassiliicoccales archaeon]MDD1755208.1 TldD/PmbA family protein [Methanomassiliicoccales archaeon]